MNPIRSAISFAFNSTSRFSPWLLLPLLIVEAVICTIVILKVSYTEIDWKTYMEQVAHYRSGQRDYAMIKGGTGPLVYPAGHLYIYSALYGLTQRGRDILTGQWMFMGIYLVTLGVVGLCYREARAPPYLLPFLVLSKRLHSIYVLRLFNDPFSVLLLFIAVLCWQKRMWTVGSMMYSLSVGVKMNTLLVLPAVGVVYLLALGRDKALKQAAIMMQLQALLATPFITEFPRSYLSGAFEFTRRFLFRWTVNWRFIGQKVFLSKRFSLGLLGLHVALLLGFIMTRWTRPSRRSFLSFLNLVVSPAQGLEEYQIAQRVTPRFIFTTVLAANTIGMLCARSLHYQFYSWLAWGTPYMLWRSGLGPIWVAGLWVVQEWAWNVFPSTSASSGAVVGVLAASVVGCWWGSRGADEEELFLEKEERSRQRTKKVA